MLFSIKSLFSLAVLLLLINLMILNFSENYIYATIDEIKYSNNKITLKLKEENSTYIIFSKNLLEIKENDKIKFTYKKNNYKGKEQYIISKLIKYQQPE